LIFKIGVHRNPRKRSIQHKKCKSKDKVASVVRAIPVGKQDFQGREPLKARTGSIRPERGLKTKNVADEQANESKAKPFDAHNCGFFGDRDGR